MNNNSRIYLAGHKGMVGSAILRKLQEKGYQNIITRTREELDLIRQTDVENFFKEEKPEIVIIAAAKVGGIIANNIYRAEFIYNNLMMQNNLIHYSYMYTVDKLLFLGSSCIYPRYAPQPIKEEYLLTGILEPTNEPYALAKIAGIKMCENYSRQYGCNFIAVMPTNLYGPNDNFDLETAHVIPALLQKFHEAKVNNTKVVEVWGSGKPKREFLYVYDCAEACVYILERLNAEELYSMGVSHINIGSGEELSIYSLAKLVADVVGFIGRIEYDPSKPDGMPRKLLDISRLDSIGWKRKTGLKSGLEKIYRWYLKHSNEM